MRVDDMIISVAYFSIPLQILFSLYQYPRLASMPPRILILAILFALFILLCGLGHSLKCIGWVGTQTFHIINGLTAVISMTTAIYLLPLVPSLMSTLDSSLQDLVKLNQQTAESKRQLLTFMAFLCHEIRNPLFAITSAIAFLEDALEEQGQQQQQSGNLGEHGAAAAAMAPPTSTSLSSFMTAEQGAALSSIHQSANLMLRLVNDVLDISKLESGKLELEECPFDLRQMLQNVAASTKTQVAQMHGGRVAFDFEWHESVPTLVCGDSVRLLQIVYNLLSNASKFTEHGSIEYKVSSFSYDMAVAQGLVRDVEAASSENSNSNSNHDYDNSNSNNAEEDDDAEDKNYFFNTSYGGNAQFRHFDPTESVSAAAAAAAVAREDCCECSASLLQGAEEGRLSCRENHQHQQHQQSKRRSRSVAAAAAARMCHCWSRATRPFKTNKNNNNKSQKQKTKSGSSCLQRQAHKSHGPQGRIHASADGNRSMDRVETGDADASSFDDDNNHDNNPRRIVLRMEITDTGAGIAADRLPHIFQPYSQSKLSDYRKHGGTGLGLSILSKITRIMGGTIHVSSVEGQGSTFVVYLPVKTVTPEQLQQEQIVESVEHLPPLHSPPFSPNNLCMEDSVDDDDDDDDHGNKKIHRTSRSAAFKESDRDAPSLASLLLPVDIDMLAKDGLINPPRSISCNDLHGLHSHMTSNSTMRSVSRSSSNSCSNNSSHENNNSNNSNHNKGRATHHRSSSAFSTSSIGTSCALDAASQMENNCYTAMEMTTRILTAAANAGPQQQPQQESDTVIRWMAEEERSRTPPPDPSSKTSTLQETPLQATPAGNGDSDWSNTGPPAALTGPLFATIIASPPFSPTMSPQPTPTRNVAPVGTTSTPQSLRLTSSTMTTVVPSPVALATRTVRKAPQPKFQFPPGENVVLIVDDNAINRKLLGRMLGFFDLECDFAENGQEAVDRMRDSVNWIMTANDKGDSIDDSVTKKHYGMIFMDMSMPVMDGCKAIHVIRQDLGLKDVPIVALTANALEKQAHEALQAGATEFCTKPILRDDIYKKCQQYLSPLSATSTRKSSLDSVDSPRGPELA